MRILVTGGTGLIGHRLIPRLSGEGHEVLLLTRRPDSVGELGKHSSVVEGDPTLAGAWLERLDDCDGVVHLAGENLTKRRWSEPFLRKVRDSRVEGTQLIAERLAGRPLRQDGSPKVLVNGSAVGYYGDRGNEELTEDSSPGDDTLARICRDWEAATSVASQEGVRVVLCRTGLVLAGEGGALPQMARPFRFFVGGHVGSGKQFVPWIHIDDLTALIANALADASVTGPVNGVAPNPVTNRQFSQTLAKVLGRPCWLPVPCFAVRLVAGGVGNLACVSQRAIPKRALGGGFAFRFTDPEPALRDCFGRPSA